MMRIVEISASQDGKSFFVYCIANFKLGLCVIPFTLSHFFAENRFYSSVHYGILHMRGDGMSDFDKSEYWFESAEYDLQTARAMLETRRLLYVGFYVSPDD